MSSSARIVAPCVVDSMLAKIYDTASLSGISALHCANDFEHCLTFLSVPVPGTLTGNKAGVSRLQAALYAISESADAFVVGCFGHCLTFRLTAQVAVCTLNPVD